MILLLMAATLKADWKPQAIDSTADFRGLCAVNDKIAWISGTQGTIARTVDGGKNWQLVKVPGTEKLDFRDIEAFDDKTAYALSIGFADASTIYKTIDGGKSWDKLFQNGDALVFLNAIAFWNAKHGLALADPVHGKFEIMITEDGGDTWRKTQPAKMPAASEKEAAFAASGTCLITKGKSEAFFVTGGGKQARVFHSTDGGESWSVIDTPIPGGAESAGAFSIAFKNDKDGIIVGGDYKKPEATSTVCLTKDGGKTWTAVEKSVPFQSCAAWYEGRWHAAGSAGLAESENGIDWRNLDPGNFNAVQGRWAVGPKGLIARRD
jgi:photosystem II stability/assembly factor-like uncharacterized protein